MATFKFEIETDNAAFEGPDYGLEVARIMRESADKIENGNYDFFVRDVNGNTVGGCKRDD